MNIFGTDDDNVHLIKSKVKAIVCCKIIISPFLSLHITSQPIPFFSFFHP
jgi:hypothetical protein